MLKVLARVGVVVALLFASIGTACADTPAFSLPFRFIDNRVFIEATVNGQGPFLFILDTGSTAVISDRAALRLHLNVKDGGVGHGVGAAAEHIGATRIDARIGALRLRDIDAAVMTIDEPDVFGAIPVDGVIGPEVFERMVVEFDYARHRLLFFPPGDYRYTGNGTVVPISRPEQIPVITATLDGVSGQFGVDTGARSALLVYGPFAADHRLAQKYHAQVEGVTGWGFGGPVRSLLARADTFEMAGANVRRPVIRLSTQKAGLTTSRAMAGLIGPDILDQFNVIFDYPRHRMILERGPGYGRPDSYDRAGLWMGQDGQRLRAVDVIRGGPADKAGVKAGDRILAVEGKDTATIFLPDLRERIRRAPPGTKLSLRLESHGRTRDVVLSLRDLV